jgi:hypothetical protein
VISADVVASRIRSELAITDPELDTSIGSPTRKIIDAVAEQISEAYYEQHLLTYQYDVDSKSDADLDSFCQLFGLARLAAKRATGTVVFTRTMGASLTTTALVPVNTEVRTTDVDPAVSVQTVTPAIMLPGITSVTVPVQAIDAGPNSNLAANTLTVIATPIEGIGTVTNIDPITGGVGQETDTELRDRFKRTVFRSMAGTEQMYTGVALDDPDCTSAVVLGASKRRREQIQISSGAATSQVQDAVFIYDSPVAVGPDIDNGVVFLRDFDWSWTTSVPPVVNVLNATAMPNGTLVDLDFEYSPQASRNDPLNGITNRVDVWVGGARAVEASQSVVFNTSVVFTNSTSSKFYTGKYVRPDGTHPVSGNVFVPLAFGPIITIPATIVIGGVTYALATAANPMGTTVGSTKYAYQIVHDDSATGYTADGLFGVEWSVASGYLPPNNSVFALSEDYTYNQLIASIQDSIDKWRLAGVDAKAHQAKAFGLRFSFAIIYDRSASQTVVNASIDDALASYLSKVGFDSVVQVSDVIQAVHNVSGVDAVRFLHGSDYSGYNPATPNAYAVGIQQVVAGAVVNSYVDSPGGYAKDVLFGDNELPIFNSAVKVAKAQNTFNN